MNQAWGDAHVHCEVFEGGFIRAALAQGGKTFVLGGVEPEEWQRQERICGDWASTNIVRSFGLHPWHVHGSSQERVDRDFALLEQHIAGAKLCGEIGLDFHGDRVTSKELQLHAFRLQLSLAESLNKPLVLHVVKGHSEAITLLKARGSKRLRGIVHGFAASHVLAQEYLQLGLKVSLGPRFLQSKHAKEFPAYDDRSYVFESDAPHHGLGEFKDLENPLLTVPLVAKKLGQLCGQSANTLLAQSFSNLTDIIAT